MVGLQSSVSEIRLHIRGLRPTKMFAFLVLCLCCTCGLLLLLQTGQVHARFHPISRHTSRLRRHAHSSASTSTSAKISAAKNHDGYEAPSADTCNGMQEFGRLRSEINSMSGDAQRIIDLVTRGAEKGATYKELALFVDSFGPRLSGSQSLANAIEYMKGRMLNESHLEVEAEKAMIPKWEVGQQWAELVEPVAHRMQILALGNSVATTTNSNGNVTIGPLEAEVVVVHSFEELDRLGAQSALRGRIVVYNYKFTTYPESVGFRSSGAQRAAKWGAMAALVRSVTPFSIYSPHTGMSNRATIPTAAITVEDADLIERWAVHRGRKVVIKLLIETRHFDDVISYNLIGDIKGSSRPNEVVFVSGHIDSWYNTQGAMDDGGGLMISYKALDVLQKLKLRARRTMRAILWTSEEFGLIGAQQYFKNHQKELENFKAVIESDEGTFKPLGLSFKNVGLLGQCVLRELLNLTTSLGTNKLDNRYEGSDIEIFSNAGVPGLSLANENSKYFYFHHTSGDSITVEDPDELDKSTALFAVATYVLANLEVDLRN